MSFRLPDTSQRLTINGRTGSGKTQFAAWCLSQAPFDKMPYVISDYKGDVLLQGIERARPLEHGDKLPKEPGLYIMSGDYGDEEKMERWLQRVWRRGSIGLYFDEGYMVPNKGSLNAILTQGRSLKIPAIILTQRPSFVTRFAFSEADFYALFDLSDERDQKTVSQWTPSSGVVRGLRGEKNKTAHPAWDLNTKLEQYHSRWYDVARDYSAIIKPVPDAQVILETFNARLKPKRRWI